MCALNVVKGMKLNMRDIENIIKDTNEDNQNKVNWTKAWSSKYPVLATYREEVDVEKYAKEIRKMLSDLQKAYNYSELDSMLVLKDILYHEWKDKR